MGCTHKHQENCLVSLIGYLIIFERSWQSSDAPKDVAITSVFYISVFMMRLIKHWDRLPRMAVEYLSLEMLKTQLGMKLSNLLRAGLLD